MNQHHEHYDLHTGSLKTGLSKYSCNCCYLTSSEYLQHYVIPWKIYFVFNVDLFTLNVKTKSIHQPNINDLISIGPFDKNATDMCTKIAIFLLTSICFTYVTLQWERYWVSNLRQPGCSFNSLFRPSPTTKTSKIRMTGICEGNRLSHLWLPITKTSNAESIFVSLQPRWWKTRAIVAAYPSISIASSQRTDNAWNWTLYNDVIMGAMASQISSASFVCSVVWPGVDRRKHHSSASLVFVRGIHRRPVNFPHKRPVTLKLFPFDDIIMVQPIIPTRPVL